MHFLCMKKSVGLRLCSAGRRHLRKVARIKGWDIKNMGHGELIQLIVREVSVKLQVPRVHVFDHLVGMDKSANEVVDLLNVESEDRRLIGILGKAGIGKKTLAKVVYNKLSTDFESCSFISDIQGASQDSGLLNLQRQLVLDILGDVGVELSSIDQCMNIIRDRFSRRKVLIVLDDVDQRKQLAPLGPKGEWFGSGSRIVVTTRDKSVLSGFQDQFEHCLIYEAKELNDLDALQLFSKHAFRSNSPPNAFLKLSEEIIVRIGGLPLAIKVIGSNLYGKKEAEWQKILKMMEHGRHQESTPLKMQREVSSPSKLLPRERRKKMEDEAGERPADVETSDRNYYAIAAVQNVVGIDDRVKQINNLLEMEVNDEVRIIGIYGTDGIGKKTLAKAVYNQISSCFDSCSFLAEVEGTTQNSHGIQFLQNKLICDILERDHEDSSFDETIEDFVDIFREMKVLIVVNAVEKPSDLHAIVGDQLDWFGPGSRIIVTSQNEEILKEYDSDKAPTYVVTELDDGQAFKLFCKQAFRMQSSIPDYDGLSNCIVNATEKLPLAIEVVGSFLRGKSIQEWEMMEKSMKARLMSSQKTTVGLQELLDICNGELDHQQKDIFLDITCFISGVDARIASYMWPNCYPSSGCILMPLAKIGENNELQMHRLLRRLGKRIFEQEGSGDPIERKFYIQEKGMENVEALLFDFTAEYFQIMPELRFLKLDNAKVSGNFGGAFASLRWLCWQRCPLDFTAKNFVLTELVILDQSWSKVTEDWGGWSEIKMEKLKVLNLTGCPDLLFTPDFSSYKDLAILILERCSHLVKLHPSIGSLQRLVSLNLKFCSQLNGLPVELGRTTALKELFIDRTSVREIPISVGNLKQLKILSGFKCFPLTHLPRSISYLTALSELLLDGAKMIELPSSLGELLNLRRLSLRDCHCLKKLPDSIGRMWSLKEFDISGTSFSGLPNSIRYLESLTVLRMDSSFVRAFPKETGNLTELEELHASRCRSLKGAIPGNIKGLRHLRSLMLGHSRISSLPPEISTITGLHTLDLIQCNEIEELPKLPPSLICLREF
ncbi:disease resistance protein RPV1-like [Eucalyptus grandis]|uniref:disease resistance protein RPV1-like n=1 Tax=Eucalyptus grandis TaxID=71139 RepID=UPI00192EAC43|nr:disease resistance protein RPV1-like [Eucalyptus grandis]